MAVTDVVSPQDAPAIAAALPAAAEQSAVELAASNRQRNWVLGMVNVSHTINHINGNTLPVVFGVIMTQLGFGYAELGILQTVNSLITNGMQAMYGFICQYVRRSILLGTGNIVMGLSTMFMGGANTFGQMLVLRGVGGAGSSPQHPVGSTMLATYFKNARGRALALHSTAGNLGQALAPVLAAALIYFFDWRVALVVVGIPSLIIGICFLLVRDVVQPAPSTTTKARAGWQAYKACLKNRDLMLVSALMMAGAAGRGGGINQTYLVPHFIRDLGVGAALAASLLTVVQVAGLAGPLGWGWLSDVFPRKLVLQLSLLLSAVTTVWLGGEAALGATLILNLVLYGMAVNSRQTLTQAMVTDYAPESLHDAAFSLYFTIGFISAPAWTLAMGAIMQTSGFATATHVIAASYVLGMLILIPIRLRPPAAAIAA